MRALGSTRRVGKGQLTKPILWELAISFGPFCCRLDSRGCLGFASLTAIRFSLQMVVCRALSFILPAVTAGLLTGRSSRSWPLRGSGWEPSSRYYLFHGKVEDLPSLLSQIRERIQSDPYDCPLSDNSLNSISLLDQKSNNYQDARRKTPIPSSTCDQSANRRAKDGREV